MSQDFSQKILRLKPNDSVAFLPKYLFNLDSSSGGALPVGPYTIKKVFTHTYSIEYQIEHKERVAYLEVEEFEGKLLILLQVHMEKEFPIMFEEFQSIWKPDMDHFVLNGSKFQLAEQGKSECDKDPYEYRDYYSKSENSKQRLFIGIENYGTKEASETDILIGYTLPLDAISLIKLI